MSRVRSAIAYRYAIALAITLVVAYLVAIVVAFFVIDPALRSLDAALVYPFFLKTLFLFGTYLPYPIVLSVFYAFFPIAGAQKPGVSGTPLFIGRITKTPFACSAVALLIYMIFVFFLADGLFDMTRKAYEQEHANAYQRSERNEVETAMTEASEAQKERDYARATEAYERALTIDPLNADALNAMWEMRDEIAKEQRAANPERAKKIDAIIEYGTKEFVNGYYERAKKNFEDALALDPDNAEALYYLEKTEFRLRTRDKRYTELFPKRLAYLPEPRASYAAQSLSEAFSYALNTFNEEKERAEKAPQPDRAIFAQTRSRMNALYADYPDSTNVVALYMRAFEAIFENDARAQGITERENETLAALAESVTRYTKGDIEGAYTAILPALTRAQNETGTLYQTETRHIHKIVFLALIKKAEEGKAGNANERETLVQIGAALAFYENENYDDAYRVFARINPSALTDDEIPFFDEIRSGYLSTIEKLVQKDFMFENRSNDETLTLRALHRAIELLNAGNLESAYYDLKALFEAHPTVTELKNYYMYARAKMRERTFFIAEANRVYAYLIERPLKNADAKQRVYKDAFPSRLILKLPYDAASMSERYLYAENVTRFDNEIYFFNVSLISIDSRYIPHDMQRYNVYRYGKVVGTDDPLRSTLVLKGKFMSHNAYNANDADETRLALPVHSDALFYVTASDEDFAYAPLQTLWRMHRSGELRRMGYPDERVTNAIARKILLPLWVLLIVVAIAFYSLRYRLTTAEKMHPIHAIIAPIGITALVFLLMEGFEFLMRFTVTFGGLRVMLPAAGGALVLLIIVYSIRFARVRV